MCRALLLLIAVPACAALKGSSSVPLVRRLFAPRAHTEGGLETPSSDVVTNVVARRAMLQRSSLAAGAFGISLAAAPQTARAQPEFTTTESGLMCVRASGGRRSSSSVLRQHCVSSALQAECVSPPPTADRQPGCRAPPPSPPCPPPPAARLRAA